MSVHTMADLYQMRSLPLRYKEIMSKQRIKVWYEYYDGKVYVAVSGGKDSRVLLEMVRELYPDVPGLFVNTGLEYPEIVEYVKTLENVEIIRPKMNFRKVIDTYGYPFISKEVAHKLHDYYTAKANGKDSYVSRLFDGTYVSKNGKKNMIDVQKWKFLTEAPFKISHKCCDVMKKNPCHEYEKRTGRKPIIGTMCEESQLRTKQWLDFGCNAFDAERPVSKPMSFWTEQDVYQYILEHNIKIASVYGDIVNDYAAARQCDGQMDFVNKQYPKKTTGCQRTGCMFCGFGCHLEEPGEGRFEKMKETHPQIYDYVMRPTDQGGLNYREIIKWINENGGFNIQT